MAPARPGWGLCSVEGVSNSTKEPLQHNGGWRMSIEEPKSSGRELLEQVLRVVGSLTVGHAYGPDAGGAVARGA